MKPQLWKIERYLLGELPESEMAAMKTLESENADFHAQIEQLKMDNRDLLAKYPMRALETDNYPSLNARFTPYYAVAAALIIAATVMMSVFFTTDRTIVMNEDGTRAKGLKTGLEIWRKTGDSHEKLANNSEASAGDVLQLRYMAEEKCYGVILSMDGRGVLTIHLSGESGKAAKLETGKTVSLKNAYELDNAPKFETFYLITDSAEFSLAQVAEGLLHGKLPKDLRVEQITLKK
ncbi:MAG: hypothetical protein FWC26_11225 [Fibromonadales bacterium]|nr:hypothetical protein [Fibromonadales bacterium]